MAVKETKAEAKLEYRVEPSVVLAICKEVLGMVGKVENVSPDGGTVSGKVGSGLFGTSDIILTMTKKGDLTELHIQTSHKKGLMSREGGAEKALAVFTEGLGFSRLAGGARGKW
jgi:hypothetical protein